MDEFVFTPLNKELLGAIRVPAPPLQRMISQLDMIRMPDGVKAAALTHMTPEKEDPDSTHPSLRQRLANLVFSEIPAIDGIQTPAASSLLADHVFKDLVTRFDSQWSKRMAAHVDIGYR
jgi:hypothetical protein